MIAHEVLAAIDALDGLLRLICHQGHAEIGWSGLCTLSEDAVVAAGLGDWDVHPHEAQAVVADLAMRLAVSVVHHYRQRHHPWRVCGDTHESTFSVLDLLRTLAAMPVDRGDTWTALETA